MNTRKAKLIFIFGVPGTGKTTWIKNVILKKAKRALIIPANADDKAWHGYTKINVKRIVARVMGPGFNLRDLDMLKGQKYMKERNQLFDEFGKVFKKINGQVLLPITSHTSILWDIAIDDVVGFRNGTFVVDDFINRLPHGNLKANVKSWIASLRHRQTDIVMAAHGPDQAPPMLFNYNADYIIFRTSTSFIKVLRKGVWTKDVYNRIESVRAAVNKVAEQANPNDTSDKRHYYGLRAVVTEQPE